MRIGFIGLGKLGLPVALTMKDKGHDVLGAEVSSEVRQNIMARYIPYREEGAQDLFRKYGMPLGTIYELVQHSEIVFVAVQTPHQPQFEGCTPLPEERADFDYSHLIEAVTHVAVAAEKQRKPTTLAVISTVLPGTIRALLPLLNGHVQAAYNPSFIAMGTTIPDFLRPEFVLLGGESAEALDKLEAFYGTLHERPVIRMGFEEAELTKVAYNTFITSKIVWANTLMEICERVGANVDVVTDALGQATDRVISPKYMRGGMGDGGGCHPRDNIALSWLAGQLGLSYDLFGALMTARERQTQWLADLFSGEIRRTGLPAMILGKAFKAGTNITVGSPAILLANLLEEDCFIYDPYVSGTSVYPTVPHVFFVGTNHPEFAEMKFPAGSVVLDPWGYIPKQSGVMVRHIGRR